MNPSFRADLHTHTTCSDGTSSPEELIELAAKIGLQGLSITDHDTLAAYPAALSIAEKKGIKLLPGSEFSSVENGHTVHILAYSFSVDDPALHAFCEQHRERRERRNRAILAKLAEKGMPIRVEEMVASIPKQTPQPQASIGRPHIAMAMVKKGYVSSVMEAFARFIGDRQPCFVSGDYFSVDETLAVIHKAHGYAILAHPHLIHNEKLIKILLKKPFDGIEGFYGRISSDREARWIALGREREWLVTGGSDFHGDVKPTIPLGSSWVTEKTFALLYQRYEENCTFKQDNRKET